MRYHFEESHKWPPSPNIRDSGTGTNVLGKNHSEKVECFVHSAAPRGLMAWSNFMSSMDRIVTTAGAVPTALLELRSYAHRAIASSIRKKAGRFETVMSNLESYFLGIITTLTPSLIILAILFWNAPTQDEE